MVPLSHQSKKDTLFKMINNEIICIPCLRLETLKSIGGGVGGILPYKRLTGMCRWMGSHFHDWIDYNGVFFDRVTRMGSHIFRFLG